jgi:hypothetical protein
MRTVGQRLAGYLHFSAIEDDMNLADVANLVTALGVILLAVYLLRNRRGKSLRENVALLVGITVAVGYGLVTRLVFGSSFSVFGSLSLSFFFITPPVLGFLTVLLAPEREKRSAQFAISAPWFPCIACMLFAGLLRWEALFCVVLALPIFLTLASIGGIVAYGILRITKGSKGPLAGALVLSISLPYLVSPIEHLLPAQEWVRQVHSQIEIDAPSEIIWQNITNLDAIQPSEQRFAFFHFVGLPRPLEAHMTCEQIGCVRRGQWEDGLAFDGTITRIEPGRLYWVSLEADTQNVRLSMAPLDQIGSQFFDMVDDGYEIEPLGNGRSLLHLYSTYRIKTGINAYASLWVDLLMQDIQRYILDIEKARSESEAH